MSKKRAKEESQYEKISKILKRNANKDLFKDITDPVQWQRQLRDEWERDFMNLNPPLGG